MLSLFRRFISHSNESSQFPFVDETHGNKLEVFLFNISTKEWSESISGSIFIEKLQKPQSSLMIIKIESSPYNLIRKITQDFELLEKDEKTWIFRVYMKTKSSEYNESNIIACRFTTKTSAISFRDFIKNLQFVEKAGFENLNFRLEIIRKKHEEELEEKESALSANFPVWDDLFNGKYYKNFYNENDFFRCTAEIREFDNVTKKWKQMILGIVKIEILKDTGQNVLTVVENDENFVRLGITEDVELISLDNRTWMWRGYKKCENVKSLLIGCRFIDSKIAKTFGISVIKALEYAPSRCVFRDEYMNELFQKEYEIKLEDNQIALETNFPGEYEIIDDDPGPQDLYFPSTSKVVEITSNTNKFIKTFSNISLSSFAIHDDNLKEENSKIEIIFECEGKFGIFDFEAKIWNKFGDGIIQIKRNGEMPSIWILVKLVEREFISKISQDLELMEKDSMTIIWRDNTKSNFFMIRFENQQVAEEFKKSVKNIQETYSSELMSDEFELDILKKLFEMELEEKCTALDVDFPSHVDLTWLNGPNIIKWRTNNDASKTDFTKTSLFHSKVDIYKFDKNINEWKKLTALPGSVIIKRKHFQEFQKTLIYAVSDEFQGTIIVKCEIASNLNMEIKNKNLWIWRGYIEMEDGNLESVLIACRFSNAETARNFKTIVTDVRQHAPWRCFLRDEYLSAILKKEKEQRVQESKIALDSLLEKKIKK